MEFVDSVATWLDPTHWAGPDGIPTRIGEHLLLRWALSSSPSLVALPLGLYIGHTGRGAFLAVNLSNIGRALPSLGILGIFLPITAGLGLGFGVPPTSSRSSHWRFRPSSPTRSPAFRRWNPS